MSDKGYLSEKREAQLSKILDAAVDFDKLFEGKKKFLGVINLGNAMERNDRKLFKLLISYVDDNVIGVNADPAKVAAFETALQFLEQENIQGFADHVAGILAGEIDIPYVEFDKQIYLSVLMMFNAIIGKAIKKIEELIAKAEAEV